MTFKKVYLQINCTEVLVFDCETEELLCKATPFQKFKYQGELGSIEYNHHSPTHHKFVSHNGAKIRKSIVNDMVVEMLVA